MRKQLIVVALLLTCALVPLALACSQQMSFQSTYQQAFLLLSLTAFGVLIAQLWLTRLLPRKILGLKRGPLVAWHKYVGYTAGILMLAHPILIVARRFWVLESDPIENLLLVLRSPLMLPAIVAWMSLALIIVLALLQPRFPVRVWRVMHGLLSLVFVGFATWHVVAVGRHSNAVMSFLWIVFAGGSSIPLLITNLPERAKNDAAAPLGTVNESA